MRQDLIHVVVSIHVRVAMQILGAHMQVKLKTQIDK